MATTAVTVTACPAKASETPSPVAMGVRRLAGRYSAVKSPKTPMVREKTAIHAGDVGSFLTIAPVSGVIGSRTVSFIRKSSDLLLLNRLDGTIGTIYDY
ncbi:hypothetical protein AOR01nite_25470 [Acetobacter orleanensis]|uniref:Uncharacterized protein n=1 Tax=Acetobacter orleanensis TaxID=104099 RepID=A0A4Y3TSS5_9PROT|nr:hypothetical protein Abol_004_006 [Acetobacter orleanensis JCM 7639]GEB84070.1 hypothetical protein AOR01nite_25470 [Acetobacter orleanensis]